MAAITKEQIIEKFRKASVVIKESDCKKENRGMITTIHPDYGIKFFTSYYTAHDFYSFLGLI